ncbi:hypothetical protein OROHE_000929 [Orobanche hederae]
MSIPSGLLRGSRALFAAAKSATSVPKANISPPATKKPSSTAAAATKSPKKAKVKKPAISGIMRTSPISPTLQSVVGAPEVSRVEAVKKIWEYIKLHNLQLYMSLEKWGRPQIRDEAVKGAPRAQGEAILEIIASGSEKRMLSHLEYVFAVVEPCILKACASGAPRASGYQSPLAPRGASRLRHLCLQVCKYPPKNPSDKREIFCDVKLKKLFAGKDKVGFLEIGKLLSSHFVKSG